MIISNLSIVSTLESEASAHLLASPVDNRLFLVKLQELLGKIFRCDFLRLLIG